jgi:hypothetical protein
VQVCSVVIALRTARRGTGDEGPSGGVFCDVVVRYAGTMIVALGELQRCPEEGWLSAFVATARKQLDDMGGKDMAYVLKGE